MSDVLLEMKNIQKSFPGVHALDNANIDVRASEVHALIGENGAGKSTLMKVLNGIYKKDGGQIIYKGEEIELSNPLDAQRRGIGMIHQELNLMPHLTVAENIFIGKEPMVGGVFLDQKKANKAAKELLASMHLDIDPTRRVKTLTVAKQQMVEIAKALNNNSELFVMDEPTSPLTDAEIEELFRFIRQLREAGRGIVYISHRLEDRKSVV